MNNNLNNNGYVNGSIDTLDVSPGSSLSSVNVNNFNGIENNVSPSIPTEAVINGKDTEYHKPKKKRGIVVLLIICLAVILLGCGGLVAYRIFFNSPFKIYENLIKEVFSYGRDIIFYDEELTKVKLSGNISIDTNLETLDMLNDYSLSYSLGVDTNNSRGEMSLGITEEDQKIIDGIIYILNNKGYLKLENLYDNLIDLGAAEFDVSQMPSTDKKELEPFYNAIENSIIKMFTKNDFKTFSTTIKVNGKSLKVKDNYIVINSSNIGTILKRFVETLESDKDAIAYLSKTGGYSESEIKEIFESIKSADYSHIEDELRISIYTTGLLNKFCGISLKSEDNIIDVVKNDKDVDIIVRTENTILGEINIEIINKNEFIMSTTMEGQTFRLSYKNEHKNDISYQIIKIAYEVDSYKFEITLDNIIESNANIASIDVSGAILAENITKEEKDEIKNKLIESIKNSKIYEYVEPYLSNGGTYVPNDFDNDVPNPACEYATCDTCSGTTCVCQYYDNNFELQTITCPKEYY